MQALAAKDFLKHVSLPLLPDIVSKLIQSLRNEDFAIDQIAALISKDPVITTMVLRHANSPRYGLSNRISSVREAIQLLGFKSVRSVAVGCGLQKSFTLPPVFDRNEFWLSSELTADFCYQLAAKGGSDKTMAWLAGFMLRLGELLMGNHSIDIVTQIERNPKVPGGRFQREVDLIGFSEGEVTAALARSWNFPEEVVAALNRSMTPVAGDGTVNPMAGVVHLSSLLSDAVIAGIHTTQALNALLPMHLLQALNLRPALIEDLYGDYGSLH